MAHIRQSRTDASLGVQIKVLETFQVVESSFGCGTQLSRWVCCTNKSPSPNRLATKLEGMASISLTRQIGYSSKTKKNVQRFQGGLVFKAHRLLYHSTQGLSVIKKKKFAPAVHDGDGGGHRGLKVRGYLVHKKTQPPWDHRRALGISLL